MLQRQTAFAYRRRLQLSAPNLGCKLGIVIIILDQLEIIFN